MTTVKYFKWQGFPKVYLKMAVWKEYSFVLSRKKQTECRGFSMGKSSTFFFPPPLPHTISQHLTFKFVLHGFILRNENQSANNWAQVHLGLKMQENINMQAVVQILKIHVNESNYCIWDFHWWAGLWAYQNITQITAFWDFGYFYSLICKQNFYNKLFLTKSYLENCLYRKPREKVNCSLWKALNYIITVENTGGRR